MWSHCAFRPRNGQRILDVNYEERGIKVKAELNFRDRGILLVVVGAINHVQKF